MAQVSLTQGNFTISTDVFEAVPNIKFAVNASGGTNKMAYTIMRSVFRAMLIAEIVNYKNYPRLMRPNFSIFQFQHCFGHQIPIFSPIWIIFCGQAPLLQMLWIKEKKLDSANHFGQVITNFQKVSALDDT